MWASRRRRAAGLLVAGGLAAATTGCGVPVLSPSGEIAEERVDLAGVDEVSISSGFRVVARQSDAAEMRLRVDDNVLRRVDVDVTGSRAEVRVRGWMLLGSGTRDIELAVPALRRLDASGGTRIDLGDGLAADTFTVALSGGSRLQGQVSGEELTVALSGGARTGLAGDVERVVGRASGGARLDLSGVRAQDCRVEASGGARVALACDERLDATASGGSRVSYDGEPAVHSEVSGGARVEP